VSNTIPTDVIIGVGTHKDVHAVAAISALGVHLASTTIPASSKGYQALETWATSLGTVRAIGIEGTGSYGAGLSRFLNERGHTVLEVNRANRQLRHQKGKSDAVDAESAARAVLAGQATGQPKSATSTVEMIRHFKVARDTAVKGRSQAMQTLKAIIVNSPAALREQLDRVTGKITLLRRLAAMRPGPITSTMDSAVRMRGHQPTLDYVRRRTAEGKGKSEIIRCLKRYLAREIFGYLCRPPNPATPSTETA